jgi:hypothetical protein
MFMAPVFLRDAAPSLMTPQELSDANVVVAIAIALPSRGKARECRIGVRSSDWKPIPTAESWDNAFPISDRAPIAHKINTYPYAPL